MSRLYRPQVESHLDRVPDSVHALIDNLHSPEKGEVVSKSTKPELVYGDLGEEIAFASMRRAKGDAAAHGFLYSSKTWGELKENCDRFDSSIYDDALERWIEEKQDEAWSADKSDKEIVVEPPALTDPFNPREISGFEDGDWPFTLKYETEVWIPEDIAAKYGAWVQTTLSGDYLAILPEHAETVADLLRESGHVCIRDDDLVWSACCG